MSVNIIDGEDENEMGDNIDLDNGDEVQEVSPVPANDKKKAHIILENLTRNLRLALHLLYKNTCPRYQRMLRLLCLVGKRGSLLIK
jgi:hypothetical protein